MDIRSIKKLSKYIHEKSLPALVHSKFNEPIEETKAKVIEGKKESAAGNLGAAWIYWWMEIGELLIEWLESRMHLDLSRKIFIEVADRKLSWFRGRGDTVAVNGKGNGSTCWQNAEMSLWTCILWLAPRIFTVGFLWRVKRVKRTSDFTVWKDLDKQQDDSRMTPKLTQQHMKRTHQRWEACQTIQNTPLCPQFRHNLLSARQPMSTI